MNKALASWMAVLSAAALIAPEPVLAQIELQRKVAAPKKPQRPPAGNNRGGGRGTRRLSGDSPPPSPPPPPPPVGIDPALVREAVAEAKYTSTLAQDAATKTAVIHVTDGKGGWSVNFNGCIDESHCSAMEFYSLWNTPNEANVCTVWNNDVTRDPGKLNGKPFCYTVPSLSRQFHLKLSSEQVPYRGMDRLDRAEMKTRTVQMIGVWAAHLSRLQEAWKIARTKCPRATDKCA